MKKRYLLIPKKIGRVHKKSKFVKKEFELFMQELYHSGKIDVGDRRLYLYDLRSHGIDLKLYLTASGIYTDFIIKQYEYTRNT